MLRVAFRRLPTALRVTESSIVSSSPRATPLFFPRARERSSLAHARLKMEEAFRYDLAVVRGVASSLPDRALRQSGSVVVDLQTALQQHSEYTKVLRERLDLQVVSLPADDLFPDCVFVEDVAVVADGVALITIPGHETRRGEAVAMKEALGKIPWLTVVEMTDPARMDGGDVLFTGREFLVGLSDRTNQEGVAQLERAFPEYSVLPVKVKEGLHLKSFMSMVGPDRIGIGQSPGAKLAREQISDAAKYRYEFVEFPDDTAANCLYVNGNLVHVSRAVSPASAEVFRALQIPGEKIPLSTSELGKVDGCLTCSSLLIKLNK